jgi:FLVCR family feline leukemia virus subgroup C receptor-related protein
LGSAFTIAGAWVRIAVNSSFTWVIIGQTLNGIGQPFILNSPAKIAAVWFKPENVVLTNIYKIKNF